MRKSMVHVSFDPVLKFKPRIPEQRIEGAYAEDNRTKRICVAPTILRALQAIPQSALVLQYMQRLELPLVIHVYYLTGIFYKPSVEEVPDAPLTQEHWLLQEPESVLRKDYEVMHFSSVEVMDQNHATFDVVTSVHLKPCRFMDNYENLKNRFGVPQDIGFPSDVSFRTFLANCGEELLEIAGKHNRDDHAD